MIGDFTELNDHGHIASCVTFYAALYPQLRQVARGHGYALALHGSLTKDLDVVAIPWTEHASSQVELVKALVDASGGHLLHTGSRIVDGVAARVPAGCPRPHGRTSWTIMLNGRAGYIDLAVMPRATQAEAEPPVSGAEMATRLDLYVALRLGLSGGDRASLVALTRMCARRAKRQGLPRLGEQFLPLLTKGEQAGSPLRGEE